MRALGLTAALLLAACGDDDGDDVGAPISVEADETTTSAVPPEEASAPAVVEGCKAMVEEAAPALAARSFPDNPDVTWSVGEASVTDAGLATVEVVPTPDEVGYPAFRLVTVCERDEAVLVGAYAREGDGWVLLFTTDERPEIVLPETAG